MKSDLPSFLVEPDSALLRYNRAPSAVVKDRPVVTSLRPRQRIRDEEVRSSWLPRIRR